MTTHQNTTLCYDYEDFLNDVVFRGDLKHQLYMKAVKQVQPENQNLSEKELIQEEMDDCWDSVWLNPLTGVSHYAAANQAHSAIHPSITRDDRRLRRKHQGRRNQNRY